MKRVLIVDDDPVIATVYKNKFLRRGFSAEVAEDGQSGLHRVENWRPDLLLLDLMLPKINGLELLRTLRSRESTRTLPVMVFSNSFTKRIAEEAAGLGALRVLAKCETMPSQLVDFAEILLKAPPSHSLQMPDGGDSEQAVCLEGAREAVLEMRQMVKSFFNHDDTSILFDLYRSVHEFAGTAGIAGMPRAAGVAEAMEALLRTLCERPQYISFSTDRTVLQGIECLEALMRNGDTSAVPAAPRILIIDDQEVALHAAKFALQKARLLAQSVRDPREALKLLQHQRYDLILLDISMPKMDGVELCARLRAIPMHANTPVIFISSLSDFEYRLESSAVGGNDFIGKPFLAIELTVKAMVWLARPREVAA